MAKAVIFDLDGTLWNTVPECANAWNRAIAMRGLAYRRILDEDVRGGMGLAVDDLRAKIFPDLPQDQGMELMRSCFEQEIIELDRHGASFFPGVLEGIPRLANRYDLYAVSNCDSEYLKAFFRVSGLGAHFKDAECHGGTGLPKGKNIQLIIERNRQRNSIESALYVGDTAGDQSAAEYAGIPFVYARYGFGRCDRFELAVDSFIELEGYLERLV